MPVSSRCDRRTSTALTNFFEHIASVGRARLLACALACALALSGAAWTAPAFADVRKADVVYGQTVDARGLAVAQCPSIDAEYAMVMGADGTVYFERNAQSPTQIASITKIMTGVVALDAVEDGLLSLDSPVTVSAAAAAVGESSAGLQEGDVMNLDAALKALLVPSGNDAAVAIAETIGALMEPGTSDPEAVFVNAMNAKAQELGCTDTVYDNPHGLDFDAYAGDLHSTAADVAKVVQYAMTNDTFRAAVGGGSTTIQVTIFDLNGNVSQSLEFDELAGNVKEGDKVGTITFKQRNTVIATMDLVACEDVDAPDFFEGVGVWWDRLFRSFSGGQEVARSITLNETPLVIDKTASAA